MKYFKKSQLPKLLFLLLLTNKIIASSNNEQTLLDICKQRKLASKDIVKIKKLIQEDKKINLNRSLIKFETRLLHIASSKGHKEMVKILINRGADMNIQTIDGYTPLYYAHKKKYQEIVKILQNKNKKINKDNKDAQGYNAYTKVTSIIVTVVLLGLFLFLFQKRKIKNSSQIKLGKIQKATPKG